MTDVREKRVELILQQMEELPTLPAIALRVLQVTSSDTSDAKDVVRIIESDPSLCSRILQLVHRSDLGVRGDVTTIDRAVVLLGFDAVRSAVLAVSVFQAFSTVNQTSNAQFSREEFWKHCMAVACCAELLAMNLKKSSSREKSRETAVDPSEAFVCGLLHDIGKVALDAMLPKSFSRVVEAAELLRGDIADIERSVIGIDHMVVGKRLCERWGLPATVHDCAWLHGQMPQALPSTVKNAAIVNLVTLADLLVRQQHIGFSGNYTFSVPMQALTESLGLSREQVDAALANLVSHIEPRAKALGLGQASASDLYLQALAQANRELGKVSTQLAAKNRKLATRAKYFDALSQFQSELRPEAPVNSVLEAIGQTAARTLDVTSCCVFSMPPGRDWAEAMLFDADGEVFETTVIDTHSPQGFAPSTDPVKSTSNLPTPAPGDGPVLVCGNELEWLLAAISPRLANDGRYWISLLADGQCIGGVIWGANSRESDRLSSQAQELSALAVGWSLALRTCQIREEARTLAEQLAEANRRLQNEQSEILRSRTLVAVGEMAAGAAHEMNNPLAVISGRSQLLSQVLSDPKHKAAAHLIFEQSHRLSEIITELMDCAKPSPPAIVETDLAGLVDHALHEAKQQNDLDDRTIEVTFGDVPGVLVDPVQVRKALTEVIGNALQATEKNGQIAIHAGFDSLSKRVVMTVTDNGCGMDEHTLKRAFDPFFSSKTAGRRRGLGLARSLRWIEASGGSIRLESRLGQGTRSTILLPASTPHPQPAAQNRRKQA